MTNLKEYKNKQGNYLRYIIVSIFWNVSSGLKSSTGVCLISSNAALIFMVSKTAALQFLSLKWILKILILNRFAKLLNGIEHNC